MKDQSTIQISQLSPAEKEDMIQMMMMMFLPVALMIIRLSILAIHG